MPNTRRATSEMNSRRSHADYYGLTLFGFDARSVREQSRRPRRSRRA